MSESGHGGASLGGVRMVSAVTLAVVPLGSCVYFVDWVGVRRVVD